jgi:hypothetical protein
VKGRPRKSLNTPATNSSWTASIPKP